MALTKAKASNILLTTPAASSNDTTPATTEYVTTAVANLIDSAPANLNTLNELAAAMADNASFFSTVLPLSGGTMTGAITLGDLIASGSGGLSLQTDEGTKRLFIKDNGDVKVGNLAVASATTAPLHVAKASTDVQAVFGDNNSSIDDPSIRIIGRDSGNSAIRYMFAGLDADANHGFIGYNQGSGSFVNALQFDTSGNVGIGTSPYAGLQVADNEVFIHGGTTTTGPGIFLGDNNFNNSNYYNSAPGIGAVGPYGGVTGGLAFYYYAGAQNSRTEAMRIDNSGKVGIGTSNPGRLLSLYNNDQPVFQITNQTSGAALNRGLIMYQMSGTYVTAIDNQGAGSGGEIRFMAAGTEKLRIDPSASAGHLQMGAFGRTGINAMAAIHGVGNDVSLIVSNGALTGNNASYGWGGRGGRYLHSNGTGWVGDGSDPAIVVGSDNSGSNRSGIGLVLHNESPNDDQFSPMIGFGNKSNSGSYNTMYASIVGRKVGQGPDANWSSGEIHFDTAGVKPGVANAYMKNIPAMLISANGHIQKAFQPFIRARGGHASMVTNQGTTVNPFNPSWYTVENRGITESGGVFTVPQAGTYLIVYNLYFWVNNSGNAVTHSSMLYHNSTGVQEQTYETGSSSHSYLDNTKGASYIMNMAAGDTFKFAVNADIYGGATHTTCCAYLLG